MYLDRLKLSNFKNYTDLDVSFSNNVNCLVGNNGVGKTNLLDALYYLSFCKSYFNPVDSQNIRMGADFFAIHGDYSIEDGDKNLVTVSCTLQKGQPKKLRFNKKVCSTFAEHIGRIPLVIITPGDQTLITGGSDLRRKFIDGVLSQVDRNFLQILIHYNKALEQRNRLLKQCFENRYLDEDSLLLWDQQLTQYGEPIVAMRREFLKEFVPLFEQYYALIHPEAPSSERPAIDYVCQISDDADKEPETADPSASLASLLLAARQRDAHALYTTVGPHKDDLLFRLGELPVKRFGSQGQQKTFLLALKLAQFEYIRAHLNVKPIMLLDDIFDKLDMLRVSQLVLLVGSDRFGQVFITDTQQGRVEAIFHQAPDMPHKIFQVSQATLTTVEEQ